MIIADFSPMFAEFIIASKMFKAIGQVQEAKGSNTQRSQTTKSQMANPSFRKPPSGNTSG